MCGNNNNTFFELSAVESNLLISNSILIGGQRRTVKKIMAYTPQWINENWNRPMLRYTDRLTRMATGQTTTHRRAIEYNSSYTSDSDSCCCTIL